MSLSTRTFLEII